MDKETYFDFLEQMLPSFSYGELDKEILEQFNFEDNGKYVTSYEIEGLAQGDIFENIPLFLLEDLTKAPGIKPVKAILLSNSCDASRRDYLNFAPFIPIKLMGKINDGNAIRKNLKNSLLYLPFVDLQDYVVDLNHIFSIKREIFEKLYEDEKINRKYSLKNAGYYLLLSKLIILHCRMESEEIIRVS
ncbi:hypothetical protein IGL98_002252 [Enterococcus sp. DIV0840]|uniref:hypothetical protein n=1 Tax=unclassified Enterococcus TaxID=2608891 RepID=UPI001A8DED95|nr:hypothetical protein [Enterococcus sp. DIV0849a]MBO0433325.1 hypothetical protein [Enterococcus sp. DIV0849a]